MLLAIACGRGPDVGMEEELSLTPFNIGAYHLRRSLRVTVAELEMLYREGVGLHYEHPETLGRKYRSWMSLVVAVRHLAEYPSLAEKGLDNENLQSAEKEVLRILIGESRLGWRQEDSRILVAAALDLLQLDDAQREVLAVLRADRSGSETPWEDLHADVRAAQALVE